MSQRLAVSADEMVRRTISSGERRELGRAARPAKRNSRSLGGNPAFLCLGSSELPEFLYIGRMSAPSARHRGSAKPRQLPLSRGCAARAAAAG